MSRAFAVVVPGLTLAASAVTFPAVAGATGPSSGSIVPGSVVAVAPYTPDTPFASGQNIDVVIGANDLFTAQPSVGSGFVNILECSAPDGVPPTNPHDCDSNTIQGNVIEPNVDGSFTYNGYTAYALPNSVSLGESASSSVHCGNTQATECILYIGVDQLDFSQPHIWSQPFFVNANSDDLGANPGDGTSGTSTSPQSIGATPGVATPEVPYAIVLPLVAIGLVGAAVVIRRGRRQKGNGVAAANDAQSS